MSGTATIRLLLVVLTALLGYTACNPAQHNEDILFRIEAARSAVQLSTGRFTPDHFATLGQRAAEYGAHYLALELFEEAILAFGGPARRAMVDSQVIEDNIYFVCTRIGFTIVWGIEAEGALRRCLDVANRYVLDESVGPYQNFRWYELHFHLRRSMEDLGLESAAERIRNFQMDVLWPQFGAPSEIVVGGSFLADYFADYAPEQFGNWCRRQLNLADGHGADQVFDQFSIIQVDAMGLNCYSEFSEEAKARFFSLVSDTLANSQDLQHQPEALVRVASVLAYVSSAEEITAAFLELPTGDILNQCESLDPLTCYLAWALPILESAEQNFQSNYWAQSLVRIAAKSKTPAHFERAERLMIEIVNTFPARTPPLTYEDGSSMPQHFEALGSLYHDLFSNGYQDLAVERLLALAPLHPDELDLLLEQIADVVAWHTERGTHDEALTFLETMVPWREDEQYLAISWLRGNLSARKAHTIFAAAYARAGELVSAAALLEISRRYTDNAWNLVALAEAQMYLGLEDEALITFEIAEQSAIMLALDLNARSTFTTDFQALVAVAAIPPGHHPAFEPPDYPDGQSRAQWLYSDIVPY